MLAIKGAPAYHDTQICHLFPMLICIYIRLFFMSNILFQYKTLKGIIICAPITELTWSSSKKEELAADYKKNDTCNF